MLELGIAFQALCTAPVQSSSWWPRAAPELHLPWGSLGTEQRGYLDTFGNALLCRSIAGQAWGSWGCYKSSWDHLQAQLFLTFWKTFLGLCFLVEFAWGALSCFVLVTSPRALAFKWRFFFNEELKNHRGF